MLPQPRTPFRGDAEAAACAAEALYMSGAAPDAAGVLVGSVRALLLERDTLHRAQAAVRTALAHEHASPPDSYYPGDEGLQARAAVVAASVVGSQRVPRP
jgi:hypothetical protein